MKFWHVALPLALAGAVFFGVGTAPAAPVSLHRGVGGPAGETVALKAGDSVVVKVSAAVLREGPSTKAKKLASLAKGTKLTVMDIESTGWLKVKTPKGQGFVFARLVK